MIFLDTDVLLDLAWMRDPYYHAAAEILVKAKEETITCGTTPIVISNIYYLLSKNNSDQIATSYIERILKIVQFIPVNRSDVVNAFASKFSDKEDAMNHFAALSASCRIIITRNVRDFHHTGIKVLTAEQFLAHDQ